ncbi:aromatic ring-hydroxylating dioxygenase subunit alpha [Ramlibacter sp. AW1]|uniref:Aromatic ring-hydroxylating dioxygenase subunit alpha n=1 Tax=Ramlibacter aurantiacus TaxID=2801330 RepID=A0A936ZF03_9BURK|nr:aromatic ring-hydroxylating dioxygenase subunit alpha [Ramlibacter aurantiacus]MBL0419068.1 aromatic ring-hydroxylating dioxygenase subunit alpha [Ramlibacter aurantiacus]
MFVRNCWYVAAWDEEVPAEGLLARTLLGEPVLLYRDTRGGVVALEDRCAHRSAPLHLGRKEGDAVRCMYHGLKFDATGACVDIPGQSSIPPKVSVRSYPVVERDRLVWIWMGDPAGADASQIVDFFWHDSPEWRMKPGYLHYQANYKLIVDNLLDFTHLAWVHPTTLGTQSAAGLKPQIERDDSGAGTLTIRRWYLDDDMPNLHKRVARFEGKVDRWQIYQWSPPALLRMDAGSAPAGTGAPEGHRVPEALQFRHTSIQTPETETTSHYWFCQARNFALDDEAITQKIFDDVLVAFEEDRRMIEGQQKVLSLVPERPMIPIAADAGLNQARWLIDRLARSEVA